jgi:hypothetical protein
LEPISPSGHLILFDSFAVVGRSELRVGHLAYGKGHLVLVHVRSAPTSWVDGLLRSVLSEVVASRLWPRKRPNEHRNNRGGRNSIGGPRNMEWMGTRFCRSLIGCRWGALLNAVKSGSVGDGWIIVISCGASPIHKTSQRTRGGLGWTKWV